MSRRWECPTPSFKNCHGISTGKKLLLAMIIGLTAGFLLAVLHPRHFAPPAQEISRQYPKVAPFKANCNKTLMEEFAELEMENEDLRDKLKVAELMKTYAKGEWLYFRQQNLAGAFGTLKSIRANTLILPDESVNPRLAKLLMKISLYNEILVALSSSKVIDMLELWLSGVKRVGIENYLVVALDDETVSYCKSNGYHVYKRDPDKKVDSIAKDGDHHAISGLKFRILREFLQLGFSVLLSDIDTVYLKNPFDYLYRDCDIESMSDGHTKEKAYGYEDKQGSMKIWVYNSGFFYIRPTAPAIELLDRVANRLDHEDVWDQQAYNEELFLPTHNGYLGLHASKRTMHVNRFMNSKTLFKMVKNESMLMSVKPVVVHLNYHPDKLERMKAVVDFFVNGKKDALKPFPLGYFH